MPDASDRRYESVRVGPDGGPRQDRVAVEEPMEVRVNGAPFAVIMRTPGADRDLAAGFLLAEDVIRDADEIGLIEYCLDADDEGRGNVLNVSVTGAAIARLEDRLSNRRQVMMTASCGLCGRRTIESLRARVPGVAGGWSVPASVIVSLPLTLRQAQRVFDATGGLHAAGLFDLEGRLLLMAEDVGRHNAVDKLVGEQFLAGRLPLHSALMLVSGRASFEIMQKALMAGIPVVAAVGAPSSLAVDVARQFGMTLLGFVRGENFNIYTGAQRISSARRESTAAPH